MKDLTPQQIVRELDRYIVGQRDAKRVVAIALRNRFRRLALPRETQDEITPKNILMIGPTGVGKTEIARRLAKIADAPFLKVEATKFTQVGYVGRDVDSIVRDLMDAAVGMVHDERVGEVRDQAARMAENRIIDIIANHVKRRHQRAAPPRIARRRAPDHWPPSAPLRPTDPLRKPAASRPARVRLAGAARPIRRKSASRWPSVWRAMSSRSRSSRSSWNPRRTSRLSSSSFRGHAR